jgi:hypothetical protein
VITYLLMVGVPILGLLGILEAGRRITAPPAIGGDWRVAFDPAANCASGIAGLGQPALSISQSGTEALVTLNDGRGTVFPASLNGATLRAPFLTATIAGKPGQRVLEGRMNIGGCAGVPFRAVRLSRVGKGGE